MADGGGGLEPADEWETSGYAVLWGITDEERARVLRMTQGMSQAAASRATGWSPRAIANWRKRLGDGDATI